MSKESCKRILLVDDEDDLLVVMKDCLQRAGFSVEVHRDSASALENYVPGRYDLVVTDIRMPKMSGLGLYQKIKSIDPQARIVFMSAGEAPPVELSPVCGPDRAAIIYKPIGMKEFLLQVKKLSGS